MTWNMEAFYAIGTLIALNVTIYAFVRGTRLIERLEIEKWMEQYKKSIKAIGKKLTTTEPISR